MTNKKRFLMMVTAAMMLISVFSVCVFAAAPPCDVTGNPINCYFYNIVPGYRVNYFARHDAYNSQAHGQTAIVWEDDEKASIMAAQVATQCVIAYTDNSYSVGNHTSQNRLLQKQGDGALSMVTVNFEANKIIDYIETEHHLTINGNDPITKVYYLYAGVNF